MCKFNCSTYQKKFKHAFQLKSLPLVCRLGASVLPVVGVRLLEHVFARDLSFEFGADEEGAAHLSVEGVGLLGRRRESLPQHHWDEAVDALGGALRSEVEGLHGGEGLAEDHHRVHVGVLHRLNDRTAAVNQQALKEQHVSTQPLHICLIYLSSAPSGGLTQLRHTL